MTSETDLWRMVVGHEREFGGLVARQNATDANVARIAEAVSAGFAEHKQMLVDQTRQAQEGMTREMSHIRGEILRIDDAYRQQRRADEHEAEQRRAEEKRRTEELIASLKNTAERSEAAATKVKQINQRIVFIIVFISTAASALAQNAPALLTFIGNVINGVQ